MLQNGKYNNCKIGSLKQSKNISKIFTNFIGRNSFNVTSTKLICNSFTMCMLIIVYEVFNIHIQIYSLFTNTFTIYICDYIELY